MDLGLGETWFRGQGGVSAPNQIIGCWTWVIIVERKGVGGIKRFDWPGKSSRTEVLYQCR